MTDDARAFAQGALDWFRSAITRDGQWTPECDVAYTEGSKAVAALAGRRDETVTPEQVEALRLVVNGIRRHADYPLLEALHATLAAQPPALETDETTPGYESVRGILAGWTQCGTESDAARIGWLEEQGVASIYLRDGRQINCASLSLRAALDLAVDLSRSIPTASAVSTYAAQPAARREGGEPALREKAMLLLHAIDSAGRLFRDDTPVIELRAALDAATRERPEARELASDRSRSSPLSPDTATVSVLSAPAPEGVETLYEPFSLYPSDRPNSTTLDIAIDGRITIAEDATPDELRAALSMTAHALLRAAAPRSGDGEDVSAVEIDAVEACAIIAESVGNSSGPDITPEVVAATRRIANAIRALTASLPGGPHGR